MEIDWDSVGLGLSPDTEVARRLRVHPTTVYKQRAARNIPAHGTGPMAYVQKHRGMYWLGLFAGGKRCDVCNQDGRYVAVFLLRGHALTLQLCGAHGPAVEKWALSEHPKVVTELVEALDAPSRFSFGRLRSSGRTTSKKAW